MDIITCRQETTTVPAASPAATAAVALLDLRWHGRAPCRAPTRESRSRRQYILKHALTQEAAYASILGEQRKVLHAGVARHLEEVLGEGAAEHAGSSLTTGSRRRSGRARAVRAPGADRPPLAGDRVAGAPAGHAGTPRRVRRCSAAAPEAARLGPHGGRAAARTEAAGRGDANLADGEAEASIRRARRAIELAGQSGPLSGRGPRRSPAAGPGAAPPRGGGAPGGGVVERHDGSSSAWPWSSSGIVAP